MDCHSWASVDVLLYDRLSVFAWRIWLRCSLYISFLASWARDSWRRVTSSSSQKARERWSDHRFTRGCWAGAKNTSRKIDEQQNNGIEVICIGHSSCVATWKEGHALVLENEIKTRRKWSKQHWYSEGIGRFFSLWYDLWNRSREWRGWGSFGLAWNKGEKVSWNKEFEEGFIMSAKIVVDKILSVIFKSVWWQLSSQSIKMDLRKPIWKSWSIHSITIFTEYSLTRYYLEVANI